MARLARVVAPGVPHHVTQRGNRRQDTFFGDDDYAAYLALLAEGLARESVALWAYCLMPIHVHLILVPETAGGLAAALGEAHRRYTRRVNFREGWRGFLWQGRFASFPLDEPHLLAAARYVERNPVRAGLCARPRDWRWSSARAHLTGRDEAPLAATALLDLVGGTAGWRKLIAAGGGGDDDDALETLRRHQRTGRPLGSATFVEGLEASLKRPLKKRRPGPKPITDRA